MISALKTKKQVTARIDLLLNLAQFHIFKPGERQIDFDSAKLLINEAASLNRSLRSPEANGYQTLTESYLINEKGQKEEAKKLAEKAVSILKNTSNKHYLGRASYELSRHYGHADPQERSTRISLVEKAVNCFEQAGTLDQNAYSLEMLGDLYILSGEYRKAIPVLDSALAAYKRMGYSRLQGVYVLLGQSNNFLRNYVQALFYMLKALKTARAVGDTSMQVCQIDLSLGVVYQRIDNKEMSVKYLNDGFAIAKKHHDEEMMGFLALNIASVYNELMQSDKALKTLDLIPAKTRGSENPYLQNIITLCYLETYTALRQFDKASRFCDTLLRYAGKNAIVKDIEEKSYSTVAEYYIAIKQFPKARYYLLKNVALNKNKPIGLSKINDEQLWYKLDSAQGNFRSAFDHLSFYKTKMDSIFSLNKVRQLQVLEVEYETTLKEDSIKAKNLDIDFLTQKNLLQAANLKQAGFIKNITIVGIILVLIIMGLLYRQYLRKQKNNEIFTQKNALLQQIIGEKEWLLKEVHHRVKNNLQIVMSLLNSQSVYVNNDAALTAIHDSQRRVYAMSLIHQKLYQSANISVIPMRDYINELLANLRDSFNSGNRVAFELDIERVNLDVSQAIPLGLIINESIVNAIKYAFPGTRKGTVSVSLKYEADDHLSLKISDDGVGMPGTDAQQYNSLGLDLIQGLAKQLSGNFTMNSKDGLQIAIVFPLMNKQISDENPADL